MAQLNFGGTVENVVIRDEFPLEKAREVLKNETIAVIGYGVQGPGQALNLRDNGFNVIVGQRQGKTYDKAVADGWVPGETLFSIEEACEKGIPSTSTSNSRPTSRRLLARLSSFCRAMISASRADFTSSGTSSGRCLCA